MHVQIQGWMQVWAAVMAAPLVDDALSGLLKAQQKAARAAKGPPAAEEDGRQKRRLKQSKGDEGTEKAGHHWRLQSYT